MLTSLINLDQRITDWFYGGRVLPGAWENILYSLASVFIYALPVILLVLFFRNYRDRLNSIKIFLAVVITWQIITKYLGTFLYNTYGFRDRPFAEYSSVKEFLFEQPTKAFPSDHSAVIMVVALSLFGYKYPRLAWPFLILGLTSSLARVVIGFHYFGDVGISF